MLLASRVESVLPFHALVASLRPQSLRNRPSHRPIASPLVTHIASWIVSDRSVVTFRGLGSQGCFGLLRHPISLLLPVTMASSLLSRKSVCAGTEAPLVVARRLPVACTHNAVCFRKSLHGVQSVQRLGLGDLKLLPRRTRSSLVVRNVAAPLTFIPEPEAPQVLEEEAEFDASKKPPFTLSDIRAAIPKHCWEKNQWKSLSYLARDVAIVFGFAAGAAAVNNWLVWPLYWAAQGTMFWALFVLGHDWYGTG